MKRGALLFVLLLAAAPAAAHPGVGMVMDSRGNVFYTDLKHVWKIAPDGGKSIAVRNVHTHELCLDAQDNLYGEHLWYEGDATKKWAHRVWRLAPDGTLFLIDGDDLVRVAPDGKIATVAKDLGERSIIQFFVGDRHSVMGLWPDAQGNVYAAVNAGRVVKKVTADGKVSVFARSRPPWSPTGGLVAPNGDVWVLEYSVTNAARARRIRPDGSSAIF